MDVNDNAGILNKRVALEFIASRLAPTRVRCRSQNPVPPLSPVGAGLPAKASSKLQQSFPRSDAVLSILRRVLRRRSLPPIVFSDSSIL